MDNDYNDDSVFNSTFEGNGKKPPRSSDERRQIGGAGCFFIAFFTFIISAFLIGICIQAIDSRFTPTPTEAGNITASPYAPETDSGDIVSTNEPSSLPVQTPFATTRPMIELDGKLPTITDTTNPFPEIVTGVSSGVVGIYNYASQDYFGQSHDQLSGTGTGFVISTSGYIVTNAHVVADAQRITVVLSNDLEIEAELIGSDSSSDIAVLKIDNSAVKLPALYLGDSDKARVGEFVITVGDPSGRELAGTITFGIVSATDRSVNIDGRVNTYIQTDAAMNPGNSGGPLINSKGEVIGMNSAKTTTASYDENGDAISAEGLGFAYPTNAMIDVVRQLITTGHIQRPGIGISVIDTKPEELSEAGIEYGVRVYSVVVGGPSETAGLREGDFIIECNDTKIDNMDDFVAIIKTKKVGDKLSITYWRDGAAVETTIVVGDLNLMDIG